MTATTAPTTDPGLLVVPTGLVLPDVSRIRLQRQFDHRPAGVVGIVAPAASLPAGSSTTTAADRAGGHPRQPLDRLDPAAAEAAVIEGVVLLEAGVAHRTEGSTVVVLDGASSAGLLIDPGAPSYRLDEGPRPPVAPGPDARPPFRWRPVVLFLAGRADAERAAVAAHLANELVPLDVEARLAVHDPLDGVQLTSPVRPEPATFEVLAPDLVIALDADAVEQAEHWSTGNRATIIARLDAELDTRVELVPWTIGIARGRLRAAVGDHVAPPELAALVNRLCSGPLPVPPSDRDLEAALDRPVILRSRADDAPPSPDLGPDAALDAELGRDAALATGGEPSTGHRTAGPHGGALSFTVRSERTPPTRLLAGLADRLVQAGHRRLGPDAPRSATDLVLLDAGDGPVSLRPRRAGTPLVVVVTDDGGDGDDGPTIDGARARAVTPSPTTAARLRSDGVTTMVLPLLRPAAEVEALVSAADRRVRPAAPAIGWLAGSPGATTEPDPSGALVAALDQLVATTPDLTVAAIGVASTAEVLASRPWILARAAVPDPDELAGWSAAVWDPRGNEEPSMTDREVLVDLALAGVPTVTIAPEADAIGALADPGLTVVEPDQPAAWAAVLATVVDETRRPAHHDRARRVGTALHGDATASLVVDRFVGWCRAEARP